MRRKEKQMTDMADIRSVIEKSVVCRLGMVDGDRPYMVPLCFGYRNDTLYFHSAAKGRKIDILRNNPNVCFEFDGSIAAVPSEKGCSWSMNFQSVIGFGQAVFIEDPEEKRTALAAIMAQYTDRIFAFPEKNISATAVFKVKIETITGKRSGTF